MLLEEIRIEPGYGPFKFYSSIEEADKDNANGKYFCIGEMPRRAYIIYEGTYYRIINFDNNENIMRCKNLSDNTICELEPSDNAKYLGGKYPL